jgi:hypothetical protein
MGGALFVSGIFVRLSPDSARTKNTIANIIASQKIARTAFDLFIVLFLLLRASICGFSFLLNRYRIAAGALRSGLGGDTAQGLQTNASKISCPKSYYDDWPSQKGNRTVTRLGESRSRPEATS